MLPTDLCRRDIPELEEAITVSDYAQIEGLSEEAVINSITNRLLLGSHFQGQWYVEAPSFCEQRLRKLHPSSTETTAESITPASYYILEENITKGPFTIGQLRSMWNSGNITGNTMHCKPGDEQWLPLSVILYHLEPTPTVTIPPVLFSQRNITYARSRKSRGVYIILGVFFGLFGIHNFYAGHYRKGTWQLLITILTGWLIIGLLISGFWAISDMISETKDAECKEMNR